MKKLKILHMSVANRGGGITQYVLQNYHFIDRNRFQFDFVTFDSQLDIENEVVKLGGKVHYVESRAEDDKESFIKAINNILDEGYHAIHLHTSYWKSCLVEELAMAKNIPVIIVHSHSTMIDILNDDERNKALQKHNRK